MVVLHCLLLCDIFCFFFFSSRRRHTRCALVTGVQTCALPIFRLVLMTGHYRQPVDWNDEVVAESRKKLDRLYGALRELADVEPAPGVTAPDAFIAAPEDEIGRASWRERVGKYGSISVVAVYLKKKDNITRI